MSKSLFKTASSFKLLAVLFLVVGLLMQVFRSLLKIWPLTYISGAILLLSLFLPLPQNGKILNVGSICAFHNLFGLPCPGCGLTRSFVAMGHGQFVESYRWHPLGPLLFALTGILFFGSIYLMKKRIPINMTSRTTSIAVGIFTVVMFVFWGLRLDGIFPLPAR